MRETFFQPAPNHVTFTGRTVNLFDPRPEDIDVRDIAHALSYLSRFNGRTRSFYSVADHSIRVAAYLPAPLRLAGLLHDAHQAYLGVVPDQVKAACPGYLPLEETMWTAIATRFDLPVVLPASIRFVEQVLHVTERRDLFVPSECPSRLKEYIPPLADTIQPLSSEESEDVFLDLFERYVGESRGAAARDFRTEHSAIQRWR